MKFNLWQNMNMNKSLYYCLLVFLVSCSSDSDSNINKGPSFGYHVDRINRVNEGEVNIGIFQAIDAEGDAINYTISVSYTHLTLPTTERV